MTARIPDLANRSQPVSSHLLPDTAKVEFSGQLSVGGVNLLDIAEGFGTPAFVVDRTHVENRCRETLSVFTDGAAYASKAFSCIEMLRTVLSTGMKIDVATGGEMHAALVAGAHPEDLVLHGNNKSVHELTTALSVGVGTIIVDSFDEIDRIESICETSGRTSPVSCLIRVTPGITGTTHQHIMTGQDDSKFGFNLRLGIAQKAVDRMRASRHFVIRGAHVHIGSQILDVNPFEAAAEELVGFVEKNDFEELCVGGGIGIPYMNTDRFITITEWGRSVLKTLDEAGLSSHRKVTAEPGRSIVGNAGVTLYIVGTIKTIPGIRTYVSIDGGMSDNPRPALYGAQYEVFLPGDPRATREFEVAICGKHCESGDVLMRSAFLPESTQIGDVLAMPATGAYGYAMASNYNRMPRPPVIFVDNGKVTVAARRETLDDLLRLER